MNINTKVTSSAASHSSALTNVSLCKVQHYVWGVREIRGRHVGPYKEGDRREAIYECY